MIFMKKPYLLFAACVVLAPVLISSNNGVAEDQNLDRTGAPGSSPSCNTTTCHTSGSFSPTTVVELLELPDLVPAVSYIPGNQYRVRVTINAGMGTPSTYGFQATAVFVSDASNAGVFSNPGPSVQLEAVGSRHIAEHSMDSPNNFFLVDWTAPEAGGGPVSFYCSGVASNNSNTDSGDGFDGFTISYPEAAGTNLSEKVSINPIVIITNPGQASITSLEGGLLRAYDISGKMLFENTVLAGEQNEFSIISGIIIFQLIAETQVYSIKQFVP